MHSYYNLLLTFIVLNSLLVARFCLDFSESVQALQSSFGHQAHLFVERANLGLAYATLDAHLLVSTRTN